MSGYKREVRPGTWELQVSTGRRDKNGRYIKKTKTFHGSARDAEDELSRFFSEVHGTDNAGNLTVAELVERYERDIEKRIKSGSLKVSAKKTMGAPLRQWIYPYIGHIKLHKLSGDDIQYLVDVMYDEGKSPKTIRNYAGVLSKMLDFARRDIKIYSNNPMQNVRLPAVSSPEPQWFTNSEVDIIMNGLQQMADLDCYKAAFLIGLFAGLRVGEVAGLNLDDYNKEARTITVRRERIIVDGSGLVVDVPKTKSGVRTIQMPRPVCYIIDSVIDFQSTFLPQMYGKRYKESGALLKSEVNAICQGRTPGDAISPLAISRAWRRFCEKNGITYKGYHKLRHTHASILHQIDGLSDTAFSKHMGHANLGITNRIYSHAFENEEPTIADGLEERFWGRK